MVISSCGGAAKSTPLSVQVKTRSADDDSEGDLVGSKVIAKSVSVGAMVLEGFLEVSVGAIVLEGLLELSVGDIVLEGLFELSVGANVLEGFLVEGVVLGKWLGLSVKYEGVLDLVGLQDWVGD